MKKKLISNIGRIIEVVYDHFLAYSAKRNDGLRSDRKRSDDVLIVEFPKSGITWFSTIISNINLILSGSKLRATRFNIGQLVPDTHMNINVNISPVWNFPNYRFIKSHNSNLRGYNCAIYLVRNPVAVMNSLYYQHLYAGGTELGSLGEFLKEEHLESWKTHVNEIFSQLESDHRIRVHMIKYEDLKESPYDVLFALYKNLGIELDKSTLKEAIESSSFEKMRDSERHYKKYYPIEKELFFVREGKIKPDINKETEKFILEETKEERKKLGYL